MPAPSQSPFAQASWVVTVQPMAPLAFGAQHAPVGADCARADPTNIRALAAHGCSSALP